MLVFAVCHAYLSNMYDINELYGFLFYRFGYNLCDNMKSIIL